MVLVRSLPGLTQQMAHHGYFGFLQQLKHRFYDSNDKFKVRFLPVSQVGKTCMKRTQLVQGHVTCQNQYTRLPRPNP